MSEYAVAINLTQLDGNDGFQLFGVDADDWSGFSVSSAGDVNGDGFDDLIIGARYADPDGRTSAGASYVVFGKADGWGASKNLGDLDGADGFRLNGVLAGDESGVSVSSAGDVNGDGFDDVIIGASFADANGDNRSGQSFVVFGKASGWDASIELSSLDGSTGFRIDGVDPSDISGKAVSSAGDVNGDGFSDIIIGAYGGDPGGDSYAGETYVVFGKASGWSQSLDLAGLDGASGFRIDGINPTDVSGISVASAGDFNGDGFDDIIIGAFQADPGDVELAGESYVVFGMADGWDASVDLAALDGTDGVRFAGVDRHDYSGSVASAGDVNGDGFDDIVIGAPRADNSFLASSGDSYVVFGNGSGWASSYELANLDGDAGFVILGPQDGGESGKYVASAGDINGDGFDDVLIGAHSGGRAYVVFGKSTGWDASLDLSTLDGNKGFQINGLTTGPLSASGHLVAPAGDINNDGFDDIVIGDPKADPSGASDSGTTYIVFGSAPQEAVERIGSAIGQRIHGGDFNDQLLGLGGSDTLVGGLGDDIVLGGEGRDVLVGGKGYDTASYAGAGQGVTVDLQVGGHQDTGQGLDRLRSIENLTGSDFSDALTGGAGANVLNGGHGADTLTGGGRGDMLTGGAGGDTFLYLAITDSRGKVDRITDLADEDVIDLSAIDAIKGDGDDPFSQVDQFTGAGGEMRLVYVAGRDQTFLDIDMDGDKLADFRILIDGDHTDHTGFVL